MKASGNHNKSPERQMSLAQFSRVWDKARSATTAYDPRVLRRYAPGSKEIYGEAHPSLVDELIERAELTANDIFYDLGSGVGNVVIQVAAQTGCIATGIEIRPDLQRIAQQLQEKCTHYAKRKKKSDARFVCADVTQYDFSDATVVFVNNFCFPAWLEEDILGRFKKMLADGVRVISLKNFRPRFRVDNSRYKDDPCHLFEHPWKEYSSKADAVSWTDKSVKYFIYRVNKSNLERVSSGEAFKKDARPWLKKKLTGSAIATPISTRAQLAVQENRTDTSSKKDGTKQQTSPLRRKHVATRNDRKISNGASKQKLKAPALQLVSTQKKKKGAESDDSEPEQEEPQRQREQPKHQQILKLVTSKKGEESEEFSPSEKASNINNKKKKSTTSKNKRRRVEREESESVSLDTRSAHSSDDDNEEDDRNKNNISDRDSDSDDEKESSSEEEEDSSSEGTTTVSEKNSSGSDSEDALSRFRSAHSVKANVHKKSAAATQEKKRKRTHTRPMVVAKRRRVGDDDDESSSSSSEDMYDVDSDHRRSASSKHKSRYLSKYRSRSRPSKSIVEKTKKKSDPKSLKKNRNDKKLKKDKKRVKKDKKYKREKEKERKKDKKRRKKERKRQKEREKLEKRRRKEEEREKEKEKERKRQRKREKEQAKAKEKEKKRQREQEREKHTKVKKAKKADSSEYEVSESVSGSEEGMQNTSDEDTVTDDASQNQEEFVPKKRRIRRRGKLEDWRKPKNQQWRMRHKRALRRQIEADLQNDEDDNKNDSCNLSSSSQETPPRVIRYAKRKRDSAGSSNTPQTTPQPLPTTATPKRYAKRRAHSVAVITATSTTTTITKTIPVTTPPSATSNQKPRRMAKRRAHSVAVTAK